MPKYHINPLKKVFDLDDQFSDYANYFDLPISFDDDETTDFVIQTNTQEIRINYNYTTMTTFIGEAPTGASQSANSWRIKRAIVSGSTTTIKYADSENLFTKSWTNKATYSYA